MSKHMLDKPIIRDLFWFIVVPYKLSQCLKEKGNESSSTMQARSSKKILPRL